MTTALGLLLLLFQFRPALPGYVYSFPRDHGSHNEFKIEWWYFTGHLDASRDERFGFELTFFRTAMDRSLPNPSRWKIDHLYIAHFALTDVTGRRFRFFEKVNRAGPGIAGADSGGLNVWNENWSASLANGTIQLNAGAGDVKLQLTLTPMAEPVIHGVQGVSQKTEGVGRASHYYSMTRLKTEGKLQTNGRQLSVTGLSWMDHEFGSNQLAESQVGWDWFSLQLADGEDVMIYRLRHRDGRIDPYSSGTLVRAGTAAHLSLKDFEALPGRTWKSPKTGTTYPLEWSLRVPSIAGELQLTPVLDDQELVTTRSTGIAYWEGAVDVRGMWRGKPVRGRGYIELTGYDEKFRPKV